MYDYISGILKTISPSKVTVDINGIGYKIHIPLSAYNKLPQINEKVTFFTSFIVREDSQTLYGFLSVDERNLFETVTTVSGIGPKTGLTLIGHIDINHFHSAISSSNIKLISKVPGIGKKTAERLIIEMRDKIKSFDKSSLPNTDTTSLKESSQVSDALSALLNLGYNHLQAQKAVNKAVVENGGELDTGKLISIALKNL